MDVNLTLSADELALILGALDSYEYWELGSDLPRNNGAVFIPGDYLGAVDPYWTTDPTDGEAEAIESVVSSRRLAARLQGWRPIGHHPVERPLTPRIATQRCDRRGRSRRRHVATTRGPPDRRARSHSRSCRGQSSPA